MSGYDKIPIEYQVLTAVNPVRLSILVTQYLKEGWFPYGNVTSTCIYSSYYSDRKSEYLQAVVKYQ